MSQIARKLCKDIVEPAVGTRSKISVKKLSKVSQNEFPLTEYFDSKLVSMEKEDASSKSLRDLNIKKSSTIHNLEPRQPCLRTVIDVAVNTIISGPLKCDSSCVTTLRKRYKCNCKTGFKKFTEIKTITRQIQTFDNEKQYLYENKACEPCILTVNCGTQFSQKLFNTSSQASSQMKTMVYNHTKLSNSNVISKNEFSKKALDMMTVASNDRDKNWSLFGSQIAWTVKPDIGSESSFKMNNIPTKTLYKPSTLSYINSKRWAMSQYPTRGPDF